MKLLSLIKSTNSFVDVGSTATKSHFDAPGVSSTTSFFATASMCAAIVVAFCFRPRLPNPPDAASVSETFARFIPDDAFGASAASPSAASADAAGFLSSASSR